MALCLLWSHAPHEIDQSKHNEWNTEYLTHVDRKTGLEINLVLLVEFHDEASNEEQH